MMNMSQLVEATRKLDRAMRAHIQAYATDTKTTMKAKLKEKMDRLEKRMEENLEQKLLSTLQTQLQSTIQTLENQRAKRIREHGDQEIERQKNDIDSFKDSILIQKETEQNEMDEQSKEQLEQDKSTQFPLPHYPSGPPTNTPSSPGKRATLNEFDRDAYVNQGKKFFLKPKRLLDSVDSLPTIQDRDDILYAYTAIRTAASPCGILITTPDTIPIYSHHRYPTMFGICSDTETNDNIDFKTGGQTSDQLYRTMSTALYSLLMEVIPEDYYEGRNILKNSARHQERYHALYMLLHSCLLRLN